MTEHRNEGEGTREIPRRALAAWAWISSAGDGVTTGPDRELRSDELEELATLMLQKFRDNSEFSWSSRMVSTCLASFAEAADGTPEFFLKAVWTAFLDELPRRDVFMFSNAIGEALYGGLHQLEGWDLRWLLEPSSLAQACLRYWCVGIRPGLADSVPDDDSYLKQVLALREEFMPDLRRKR